MSRAVEVRELKIRLGSYLREVRRGRTIVVTDRGEPVAELRPIVHIPLTCSTPHGRIMAARPGHPAAGRRNGSITQDD